MLGGTDFDELIAQLDITSIERAGRSLGNLIAYQAAFGPLETGELRKSLCAKVSKGLAKRKRHSLDNTASLCLASLSSTTYARLAPPLQSTLC